MAYSFTFREMGSAGGGGSELWRETFPISPTWLLQHFFTQMDSHPHFLKSVFILHSRQDGIDVKRVSVRVHLIAHLTHLTSHL